jgi:hypothetical protein
LNPGAVKLLDLAVRWAPLPGFLRRKIFDTAYRIGLSQVKLLNKDNNVANIRHQDLDAIFSDPKKTLSIRFPQLDLGSIYRRGFLEKSRETETDTVDSIGFSPKLTVGQRLPHFWLMKPDGNLEEKLSSLDLSASAVTDDGRPCHLLLILGIERRRLRDVEKQLLNKFSPLKKIYLSGVDHPNLDAVFSLAEDNSSFLSPQFAVLVRPDGHVAWLENG